MNKKGILTGLSSGLFWGIGLTISGLIVLIYDINPFVVAFIHDFFSVIILGALLLIINKKIDLSLFKNITNYTVVVAAILAGPVGMQLNLMAIKYIGVSLSSSVTAIYPAISVILSMYFLKQKVTKNTLLGIFLIVAGLFFQTFESANSSGYFYIGVLCAFLCAFAWGSESVLSSFAMSNNLSPIEALFIRQVTSLIIYGVLFLFNGFDTQNVRSSFAILSIVLLAASNMISYILYYMTIKNIEPSRATGLNVTYVLWASFLAYIFLHSELNFKIIITSIIIIGGVYTIIKE